MSSQADVENEYEKNRGLLKKDDVRSFLEWSEKQPHLPKITELQAILFLQSCYFNNEIAKATIDNFFTVRTLCPEVFGERSPNSAAIKAFLDVALITPLPKPTPEGHKVIFIRMMDCNPDKYVFTEQLKYFDMVNMLCLNLEGTAEGQIIVVDQEGIVFGHFTKIGVMPLKKFLYYLQEAMPVRLKGLHFVNIVPFIDKLMALMKPFMKKELMDVLHLHTKIDSLHEYVPKECLPKEYGGTAGSFSELHDKQKKLLAENADFFLREEKETVDESKRPGKPKKASDVFGVEGTFKKLDID